jgi:hypothetical protein
MKPVRLVLFSAPALLLALSAYADPTSEKGGANGGGGGAGKMTVKPPAAIARGANMVKDGKGSKSVSFARKNEWAFLDCGERLRVSVSLVKGRAAFAATDGSGFALTDASPSAREGEFTAVRPRGRVRFDELRFWYAPEGYAELRVLVERLDDQGKLKDYVTDFTVKGDLSFHGSAASQAVLFHVTELDVEGHCTDPTRP